MHMHARLEALYNNWVLFYKEAHWNGGSMSIDHPFYENNNTKTPSLIKRLFVGSFFQPLDSIEEYFGERVAFYFAWLQHCSLHLTYLSILGLIIFSSQMVSGTFDHILRPYFSIILMIWSFFVMVEWRKRQNFLAHRWGTMNYKEEETTRPQFRGEYKTCEITGAMIVHYPSWKRWLKYCISVPLTVVFTVVSLLGFLIVHANRDIALARYLNKDDAGSVYDFNWSLSAIGEIEAIGAVTLSKENLRDFKFWYIVAAMPCALGLSLPLLNFILMQLSRRLNDFENYKTESQYMNALTAKVIAFRFVTYFSALYYYAYISTGKDDVTVENSILRVATSLVIYLTVAHWWGIFLGIYIPLLVFRWKLYLKGINLRDELRQLESMEMRLEGNEEISEEERRELEKLIANKSILLEQAQSKIWEEIMLPDYNPFFDYILAIIHFAFVVCFSAVLPITPLLVLINQVINMRLNAYKICRSRRRPLAQKTGGIGVWAHVLHIVTVISILTNCSLMILTSSEFNFIKDLFGDVGLFAAIVCWEHIMLIIKYLMQSLISPYPASLSDALKKEEYEKTKKRNSNLRAKNERRSNVYSRSRNLGKSSSTIASNIDEDFSTRSSETGQMRGRISGYGDSKQEPTTSPSTKDKEFSPLLQPSNNDRVAPYSAPVKYVGKENHLRRRKKQKDKMEKLTTSRSKQKEKSGLSNAPIRTPKASTKQNKHFTSSQDKKNTTRDYESNDSKDDYSPFAQYYHDNQYQSPILNRYDGSYASNDDTSIGGLLSVNSAYYGDSVDESYNSPLKASMSRARFSRESREEERAAQERIQKRISRVGDRRRKIL